MSNTMNIYWPIYQRIEDEVIHFSNMILFNDEQKNIYSPYIGELIVRCAVEIESLSKELYAQISSECKVISKSTSTKKHPHFDKDCIDLLIKKWKIDKKQIQISNPNMYFEKETSILTPLNKSNVFGSNGSEWKQAYQSIKHDRAKEIKCANIENLLNALGALYILNLYYKNTSYWEDVPIKDMQPYRNDSQIFSPFIFDISNDILFESSKNKQLKGFDESIYIKKLPEENMQLIRNRLYIANFKTVLDIYSAKNNVKNTLLCQNKNGSNLYSLSQEADIKIENNFKKNIRLDNISADLFKAKEIVLNHNDAIYNCQTYEEFLKSDQAKNIATDYEAILIKNANEIFSE